MKKIEQANQKQNSIEEVKQMQANAEMEV